MNQSPWRANREGLFEYYVVVPHASEARLLLFSSEDAWTLPRIVSTYEDFRSAGHLNEAMKSQFGLDTLVARCMSHHSSADGERQYRVYALENRSSDTEPPDGGRWVGREELAGLALDMPEHRDHLEMWFAERVDGLSPTLRAPWAIHGWFDSAIEWIESSLEQSGIAPAGPIEQVRAWALSCLMRLDTDAGYVYFKAVPPFMAQEASITRAMSQRYPEQVPPPIAIEGAQGWTLMRDFGGKWLGYVDDIEAWENAVRAFSEIQLEQVEAAGSWVSRGYPDRGLGRMVDLIDPLFAGASSMLSGRAGGLTEDEVSELQGLSMRLKLTCANLASYKVPQTLIHGDLGGNIIAKDDGFIYFDWTDVCVSHPFFDTTTLVDVVFDEMSLFHDVPDARDRLRDAFLEPWIRFEPMERLLEAYEVARPLGVLHQAMSYMWILSNIAEDARWELEGGLVTWLRNLLKVYSSSS